tara:strand:+ start:6756 stop:7160 length:405 start_codon:yes stop_codon:yes gene_type:complete
MDSIGLTIRKINVDKNNRRTKTSRKNLQKQMITLHRKLKKVGVRFTEYSIEKDPSNKGLHIHLKINCKWSDCIKNQLSKYIGGMCWIKDDSGKYKEYQVFKCNGKFGEVHYFNIDNIRDYSRYINKIEQSKSLI